MTKPSGPRSRIDMRSEMATADACIGALRERVTRKGFTESFTTLEAKDAGFH